MRRRARYRLTENYLLLGAIVVASLSVVLVLSYYANTGVPGVPVYRVTVEFPNAERLNVGAPVQIGGARVGVVRGVDAIPARGGAHAYATADLALEPRLGPLPVDSRVTLRPQSVLGGKYVALEIGHAARKLRHGQHLPLSQAVPTVEIEDALRIFDKPTSRALTDTIVGYGNGLAGRGTSINQTIGALAEALPPLERVATLLAKPSTGLGRLIRAGAHLSQSVVPVTADLGPLFDELGPTLAALDGPDHALGRAIAAGPATQEAVYRDLGIATPVLADATTLLRAARPGIARLPQLAEATRRLFTEARPALRATPDFARRTSAALRALDAVARGRSTTDALRVLTATMRTLKPTLRFLLPAQTVCNTLGLFLRNVTSAGGEGDDFGPWNHVTFLSATNTQMTQSATPDADLHYNALPRENATECEAGNEPYKAGQAFGHPAGRQSTKVDRTAPPAAATARARAAGLLTGTAR